jgi:uncharacterized protein (TIGR02594 family)
MKVPNWLLIAQQEIGEKEVRGGENPRILAYLRATDLGSPGDDEDETPWCSGFVNWVMQRIGFKGTRSAWAQSWATWGKEVDPVVGAIVVFRWANGTGHVGFVTGLRGDMVKVLGGNQKDSVCECWFNDNYVIGYRMPAFTPVVYVRVNEGLEKEAATIGRKDTR